MFKISRLKPYYLKLSCYCYSCIGCNHSTVISWKISTFDDLKSGGWWDRQG